MTEAEGSLLATAIVLTADTMVLGEGSPGDVVDLDLIGHSRGAVVISQALQDLDGTTFPALAGGFKKMTLLDPHPANNGYSKPDYSAGSDRLSRALVRIYRWLQAHMQDPQVIIPPNVDEADLYYQHSPASAFPRGSEEAHLNLWGEDPSLIVNQSSAPLTVLNLTGDVDPDFGTIGHSEVPLWYDKYIVQQGIVFQGYSGPGDSVDQSAIALAAAPVASSSASPPAEQPLSGDRSLSDWRHHGRSPVPIGRPSVDFLSGMHPVDALIAPTTSRANQSLQPTLIIALDDAMTDRAEESASIAAVPTSRALVRFRVGPHPSRSPRW